MSFNFTNIQANDPSASILNSPANTSYLNQLELAQQQQEYNSGTAPPPAGLVNPNGDPNSTEATILQDQMANWEQVYKPVELNLLQQSSLENPNVLTNAIDTASTTAAQTNTAMQGVEQRQLASRGIAATPQQQQVDARLNSLNGAANVAGAQNQARQTVSTNNQLIAMGSAPNPNLVNGQQLQNPTQQGG